MRMMKICAVVSVAFLMAIGKVRGMETISAQDVSVHFPEGCEVEAKRIVECAQKARATFMPLFRTAKAPALVIHWRTKTEWLKVNPKGKYGMPHPEGNDVVILPAVNLDPADALTEIIGPLTHPGKLPAEDLQAFMDWTPAGRFTDLKKFEEYLGSRSFYTDFVIDFVLPHEIMHCLCNQVKILRKPVWPYEGIAQWASDYFLRQQGREKERRFYFLLYKMFYVVGKEDAKNKNLIEFGNYAWFHGALLTWFRELEEKAGNDLVPRLIRLTESRVQEKKDLAESDWFYLFKQAGAGDLSPWF